MFHYLTNSPYKLITLFVILLCPFSLFGQITIGDSLNLRGAASAGIVSVNSSSSAETTVLEFEELILELGLDYEKLDASLEFELVNGSFEIDAAFLDYQFNDTISFSAGRMYSLLLYEHIDPTRRLNRTNSYTLLQEMVPTLGTGVRGLARTEKGWVSVGWADHIWCQPTSLNDSLSGGDGSVEIQMGFLPFSGLEVAISYGGQDSGDAGPSGQMWNTWISHSGKKHLLVAEYLDFENAGAQDANGNNVLENSEYLSGKSWMLLGNYKTSTDTSMTFRLSNEEQDGVQESLKYSVTPSFQYSDNLTFRGEISRANQEVTGQADVQVDTFSLEGLFRF